MDAAVVVDVAAADAQLILYVCKCVTVIALLLPLVLVASNGVSTLVMAVAVCL